jgi:acyl-CoA thioesterase
MGLFNQTTQIERIAENHWRANLSEHWCVGPVPNGGYLLAIIGRALSEALTHVDPSSLNAFYLAPTEVGVCEIKVELLRQGGSTSFAMARLFQNDELKVQVTAAYTDLDRVRGETQLLLQPPQVPAFEDCAELPINDFIAITKSTHQRVIPGQEKSMLGEPQGGGEWLGWIDFRDDNPVDVFSLLYFSDAFPPPAFTLYGPTGWVPTLDLSVQVRGKPAPGPLMCRFTSKALMDGTLEEDGALWDNTGKLVLLSRQTAKFRLPK